MRRHKKKQYNRKLYPTLADRIVRRVLWIESWLSELLIGVFRYGIPDVNIDKYKYLKSHDTLVIIANGPTILEQQGEISSHKNCDYACMNYYPIYRGEFDKLKPIYYFGVDVMLYDKNHPDEGKRIDTKKLRGKLNRVGWDMLAFMYKDESLMLENKHIHEVRLTNYMIDGVYSRFRGWLFDNNLAMPTTRTVATLTIQTGIRLGYKKIYVYGVDMSQHEGVTIDQYNKVHNSDTHFYKSTEEKKAYRNDFVGICEADYYSLRSFRTLNEYARRKGCWVINCSKNSYVDAFERRQEK